MELPMAAPAVASPGLETFRDGARRYHAGKGNLRPGTATGVVMYPSAFHMAERCAGRKADRSPPFSCRFDMRLREVVTVLRKIFEQVSLLRYQGEFSRVVHAPDDSVYLVRFQGGYPVFGIIGCIESPEGFCRIKLTVFHIPSCFWCRVPPARPSCRRISGRFPPLP